METNSFLIVVLGQLGIFLIVYLVKHLLELRQKKYVTAAHFYNGMIRQVDREIINLKLAHGHPSRLSVWDVNRTPEYIQAHKEYRKKLEDLANIKRFYNEAYNKCPGRLYLYRNEKYAIGPGRL